MKTIRQLVKLVLTTPLGNKQIADTVGASRTTVLRYRKIIEEKQLQWQQLEGLTEDALDQLFNKVAHRLATRRGPDFVHVHEEMARDGVTLQLLWEEYRDEGPEDALSYSQFTDGYRRHVGSLKRFMRMPHPPGKTCFVDFSGKRPAYTDPSTGESITVELFVGNLGKSNLIFATAVPRQTVPFWIEAHARMFAYFGGVTQIIVPDNLKSAVIKAGREFIANASYQEMADHYGTSIVPARVYRPKDKAKVENTVLIVQRWILARLRNRQFFSLEELERAIRELVDDLNKRPFKRLPGNRLSRYEEQERAFMQPLPATPYEYAEWLAEIKVDPGYHVLVDRHWYSVPHTLVGKRVRARVGTKVVEFFHQHRRIASHLRSDEPGGLTTLPEHQPEAHRAYAERSPEKLLAWAQAVGPNTLTVVQAQFDRKLPALGLPACESLRSLERQYGKEELEAAAARAVEIRSLTVTSVRSLLRTRRHRVAREESQTPAAPLPDHHNVRGADYYAKEGAAC